MDPIGNDGLDAERLGVVVGVDGSRTAFDAVGWAAAEAQMRGLPLQILHAAPYAAGHDQGAMRRAQDILARAYTIARRSQPELAVTTRRTEHEPVRALLGASRRAQLLVLGMIGGEQGVEMIIDSVALDVCGRASCPVAFIHRAHVRPDRRDVIAGLDSASSDGAVLDVAFADAALHGDGVTVLHAHRGSGPHRDQPSQHEEATRITDELSPWKARHPEVPARVEVVDDHPAPALLVASDGARLVVVGSRRRGPARILVGSTSRHLLRHCPVPVVVVNPDVTVTAEPRTADAHESSPPR